MSTHVQSVSTGYRMDERKPPTDKPRRHHGFVSATEWLRDRPLPAKLVFCTLNERRQKANLIALLSHSAVRPRRVVAALRS